MNYINLKTSGTVETIDEFETRKEANRMLIEYRVAFGPCDLYVSSRCDNTWHVPATHEYECEPEMLP